MEKNYDNAAADIEYVRSELSRLVKDPELSAILGDEAVERMSKWDAVIGEKMVLKGTTARHSFVKKNQVL